LCPEASLYSFLPPLVPAPSSSAQNLSLTSLRLRVASGKRSLRGLDRVGRASTLLPSGEYLADICYNNQRSKHVHVKLSLAYFICFCVFYTNSASYRIRKKNREIFFILERGTKRLDIWYSKAK
jgi:hypothetical protein